VDLIINSVQLLIYVTGLECVYSAVRTGFLKNRVTFRLNGFMERDLVESGGLIRVGGEQDNVRIKYCLLKLLLSLQLARCLCQRLPSTCKPDSLNVTNPFGVPVINGKASCERM